MTLKIWKNKKGEIMKNELATIEHSSALLDPQMFQQFKEVSKMLATSSMVPEHFQGAENVGNCMIALDLASRLKVSPFMLMQRMYTVHGKPGFEAQMVIALINNYGKFTPLRWKFEGSGDNLKCICYATDVKSNEVCEAECSVKMAKAEGWWSKNKSKWPTMTEQMLRYRSAAFFGRLYAPEAMMGMPTVDELYDIDGKIADAIKVEIEEVSDVMEKAEKEKQVDVEDKPDPEIKVTKNEKQPERLGKTEPAEDPFLQARNKLVRCYQAIRNNLSLSPSQNKKLYDSLKSFETQDECDILTYQIECLEKVVEAFEALVFDEKTASANVKEILTGNLGIEGLNTLSAALQEMIESEQNNKADQQPSMEKDML